MSQEPKMFHLESVEIAISENDFECLARTGVNTPENNVSQSRASGRLCVLAMLLERCNERSVTVAFQSV